MVARGQPCLWINREQKLPELGLYVFQFEAFVLRFIVSRCVGVCPVAWFGSVNIKALWLHGAQAALATRWYLTQMTGV